MGWIALALAGLACEVGQPVGDVANLFGGVAGGCPVAGFAVAGLVDFGIADPAVVDAVAHVGVAGVGIVWVHGFCPLSLVSI